MSINFTSHYVQIKHLKDKEYRKQYKELYIPLRSDKTRKVIVFTRPIDKLYIPLRSDKTNEQII